jgi:hypothetical protein
VLDYFGGSDATAGENRSSSAASQRLFVRLEIPNKIAHHSVKIVGVLVRFD